MGIKVGAPPTNYEIAELALRSAGRVNRFEEKAAFTPIPDLYQFATPAFEAGAVVSKADVIDLTSKMHPGGTLDWTPPPGRWTVVRFGYSLLGITNQHMSLPVLSAIYKLVQRGAVVARPKPADDPSLADDQVEFHRLFTELFGDGTSIHKVGKGTVYAGQNLNNVFRALQVAPDFDYTKPDKDTRILFVHRKLADGDLYFLDNRGDKDETVDASFRMTGKAPELWHAETGKPEPASYKIADGRTTIPMHLEPWGTVFVVFRERTTESSHTLPKAIEAQLGTIEGSWNVSFQPNRGAPSSITLNQLTSWSESQDAGVKYFSGTGTYTKTINARAEWFKRGGHQWIDLGGVKNLAEVTVNDKALGVIWHAPYRVDATNALKPGEK
ncbi:MAG TPA: glycosyl hydrolase [Bryobacteraceae bacterium]|jgi:hypothetical protein|nr:glycosyl hydrolase [Bryobacteraceae bacterium]